VKVQATDIEKETPPKVIIELFRDRNGNWFASVEERGDGRISLRHTATYTTPLEACEDALRQTGGSRGT
jgi:hypothetical protein